MRRCAFLAGAMMLTVLFSPAAMALWEDTDGYYMAITYPAGDYEVGDTVPVTVHLFEKGVYADVDNVTFAVGTLTSRDVDLSRAATGKWEGSLEILEDDVTDSYTGRVVFLAATAEMNDTDVEDTYSMVQLVEPVEVSKFLVISPTLDPPGVYMRPGETKTVTWRIYYEGALVDPTTSSLYIYEDGNDMWADPAKESTGVYSYEYTMPDDQQSLEVDLSFEAEYEVGTETVDGSNEISLYKVLLHVWAKKVSASTSTATFDVFVSNASGGAVEAAAISLDYSYYDDNDDYQEKTASGTTDADGKASIDLSYTELGDLEETVDIGGRVTGQGKEQDLSYELRVRTLTGNEPDDPSDLGFDAIPQKDTLEFDKAVNLPVNAYFDAEPLGSSPVYWYAHTLHAVLNKGTANTNVQGALSVDFRTPKKDADDPLMLFTHFETPVEESGTTYYYEDTEYVGVTSYADIEDSLGTPFDALTMFKDDAVKTSVSKLEKGRKVPVTVEYAQANNEWTCMVMMGIEPDLGSMGLVPAWTYWSVSLIEGAYGDMGHWDGTEFQASIFIPENLPNKDYYVAGLLINQVRFMESMMDMDFAKWIKTSYVQGLPIGQGGTSGGEEDKGVWDTLMDTDILGLPVLYWIFIIIILVILGVAIAAVVKGKGAGRAPDEPGLEPSEGPEFGSDLGPPSQMPMPPPSYDQMQPMPGQVHYGEPMAQDQYAPPPQQEYAPPQEYAPQEPQYGAPLPPPQPQPQYAPPAPQPEYAPPAPQPEYAPPPPQPEYAPPAPQPQYAPPAPQPQYAPPPPPPTAPAPPTQPVVAPVAPPPPPAQAAPAAPAASPGATMTIRCQKCQTTLTIPRKRPIKVTCPNCGASGVLR